MVSVHNGGVNMSGKNNTTCAICGKAYAMCYSCSKKDPTLMWKIHCDTPEHFKIFQVIKGYTTGVYDADEAAMKLKNIDLSDIELLRDNIRDIINEIFNSVKNSTQNVVNDNKAFASDDVTAKTVSKPTAARRTRKRKQTSVNKV